MKRDERMMLEFESTGAPELDRILGRGLPARSIVVVAGEPGSGKTVFTLQTLFHQARQGKKCLYLTTVSEPAIKVIRYMQMFDFFDVDLVDRNVVFSDLGSVIREGAAQTLDEIARRVEQHQPAFVAIDSFRAIGELLRGTEDLRKFTYDLAVHTAAWGATTLLVGEYAREEHSAFAEFAVADGIIRLGTERKELTSIREIEILKLRGAAYCSGQHFYEITQAGLSFYPRVSTPADLQEQRTVQTAERAPTGVSGLDDLLGGGLPQSSATILQGGTGTGKTMLSLQFVLEGVARGEKCVYFTLEETPDQLRAIARGLGWDLAAAEKKELLVIKYTSPVELSTDRFLQQARNEVRELGARRAVFDSLTTLQLGIPSERRFKEMVYALAKHMRGEHVSLVLTVESEQLLGTTHLTGNGASFIADNVIQMRYVELGGRLERAISVLKARGIAHSSELRSLTIGREGIRVVKDRFKDLRGVLTGLPARESGERR